MKAMKAFDEQMPCVGVFWYDLGSQSFSFLRKMEINPKIVEYARQRGESSICYPEVFEPINGRIIWSIDKFIVLVGHWAEPILDELTVLLEKEFSLPYFEFVYDEHWDLGHGWPSDLLLLQQRM